MLPPLESAALWQYTSPNRPECLMATEPNPLAREGMDRVRFMMHRDKRILLVDFTHCSAQEVGEICDRVPALVTQEPPQSVRILSDFTGAEFTRGAIERLKVTTAIDKPYIHRVAWVLDDNMPKALYDSVRTFSTREFPVFSSREEALEYLVG